MSAIHRRSNSTLQQQDSEQYRQMNCMFISVVYGTGVSDVYNITACSAVQVNWCFGGTQETITKCATSRAIDVQGQKGNPIICSKQFAILVAGLSFDSEAINDTFLCNIIRLDHLTLQQRVVFALEASVHVSNIAMESCQHQVDVLWLHVTFSEH